MNRTVQFVLALMVLAATGVLAQSEHEHHHHGIDAELTLQLNDGERWPTDAPLRTGMTDLRAAFEATHSTYRDGDLEQADADSLADRVEQQVNFIFATCSLPPAADAELHKLLAAALGAAVTLREDIDPHAGLHQLHTVLKTYGEYFDHPGWNE